MQNSSASPPEREVRPSNLLEGARVSARESDISSNTFYVFPSK